MLTSTYKGKSLSAFLFFKKWCEKTNLGKPYLAKATKKMKKWANSKSWHIEYKEDKLSMVKLHPYAIWTSSKVLDEIYRPKIDFDND